MQQGGEAIGQRQVAWGLACSLGRILGQVFVDACTAASRSGAVAFCAEAAARVTDEIVDLFDDGIAAQHAKARRALVQRKLDVADSADASVVLLGELLEILLDPEIPDLHVRQAVWQRTTPEELQLALELAAEIRRPLQDTHLCSSSASANRAARDFAPRVLATLKLRANPDGEALLVAVDVLRDLNRRGVRRVPDDAPSASCRAAGARMFISPTARSTAITGSCACSASCATRCAPAKSGCRAAAATPTPSAS